MSQEDFLKKIVIFASGTGSNAGAIMEYFKDRPEVQITCVFTNNSKAGVLKIAENHRVSTFCFNRSDFYESERVMEKVRELTPDLIVLAGFMWKIPENFIDAFLDKIINLHPSLLPKYGGKGMYGHHVHKAVLKNKEQETGISIHFVNEFYDEGRLIAQYKINLTPEDNLDSVQQKIKKLEHKHLPEVIDNLLFPKE